MITKAFAETVDKDALIEKMIARFDEDRHCGDCAFEYSEEINNLDYMAMNLGYCLFYKAKERHEKNLQAEIVLASIIECQKRTITEEDVQRAFIQSNKEFE